MADIYDQLDPDRSDLDVYASIARELGARSAVDIGCGTGTLACLLAEEELDVVGVDPAAAMLAVARRSLERSASVGFMTWRRTYRPSRLTSRR